MSKSAGLTVSSASVTAVISGSAGRAAGSVIRGSMMTVLVSRTPRKCRAGAGAAGCCVTAGVQEIVDVGAELRGNDCGQGVPPLQQEPGLQWPAG
jgi:hypothetical protein